MTEARTCPTCGSTIPPDAPSGGLCPKCLLQQGMASMAFTRQGGSGAQNGAPSPSELAPLFPQLDILEIIGRGGMGIVYKARQKNLDRLVALKILTFDPSRDPAFSERFLREARTLARLSHPNIVGIHDFGQAGGHYYFLMEFVDGASLREVLQAGKLAPQQALGIVPRICEALQFAHEEGIVHRDIKPENILLDEKGRVKIADFGLAKLMQRERLDFTLTEPGQVMGTPAYMAPEQIEKPSHVDHRADIFSLGVVFYEMLTGELPLGRFAPPSQKVQVDLRLDEVVLRTLEKEPQRRYQHASDVKVDVESIDTAVPGAAVPAAAFVAPASAPPPSAPRPEEHASPPPAAGSKDKGRVGAGLGVMRPSAESEPAVPTVKRARPRGVKWIAIWCFVNGASFLFGVPSFFFGFAAPNWARNGLPRFLEAGIGIYCIIAGIGLLDMRRWGRNGALVLATFGLIYFPLGTLVSILILVYLLRRERYGAFEGPIGPVIFEVEVGKKGEPPDPTVRKVADSLEDLGDAIRGHRGGPAAKG